MCRLIESIRLNDGIFCRLPYHQNRMNQAWMNLFGRLNPVELEAELLDANYPAKGLFKCRLVYDEGGIRQKEFIPYSLKSISRLYLVNDDAINYQHKFEDRSLLEKYRPADKQVDVLIICNGYVTDALYANVVFFDGNRWLTPAQPLLKGTMRQALLDAGLIAEEEIHAEHIRLFSKVKRINALMQFDDEPLSTSQII